MFRESSPLCNASDWKETLDILLSEVSSSRLIGAHLRTPRWSLSDHYSSIVLRGKGGLRGRVPHYAERLSSTAATEHTFRSFSYTRKRSFSYDTPLWWSEWLQGVSSSGFPWCRETSVSGTAICLIQKSSLCVPSFSYTWKRSAKAS